MKEKALKTQKSNRICWIALLICAVIEDVALFRYYVVINIDDIKEMPPSTLLHYLFPMLFCFLLTIVFIFLIIHCSINIWEIHSIDWPNGPCFNVQFKQNSLYNIYLSHHAKQLHIWYVNDKYGEAIKYRYMLDGKKYGGRVTIRSAKTFFKCPYLEYL